MPEGGRGDSAVALSYRGGEHRMSTAGATLGASGIELGILRAATRMVTLDPGFVNTAGCTSA
ncbi:MAG: citrate (Si)-synthase, partial [Pseudonocardiales bacterium]